MKIVVLDGYTLNPGDLSWDGFDQLGSLQVYDRTFDENLLERAKGVQVLLTNKTPLDRVVFEQLPELKYVGVLATGYNVVDLEAARQHEVIVTNVPTYGTNSVAQMTFALLLELCQRVQRHSNSVKDGDWARSSDFCYSNYPLVELAGKTMGIIGFGDIGSKVADIATAFGMEILASDRTQTGQSKRNNFAWVEIPELLEQSDVVSMHCPLNSETRELINKRNLRKMKKTAFLINTSRGPIIAEADLAAALNEGTIAGAALDVLVQEPPSHDNPLYDARNCIITPHIAWATMEARSRLMNIAVKNLEAFLNGKEVNVVNKLM